MQIRPHRPRTVTFIIGGVFLLGMWNAGRAIALAQQSRLLRALAAEPDPIVRLLLAVGWAFLLFGLVAAFWQKRPFTRVATPILLTIYALIELVMQRLFAQTVMAPQQWLLTGLFYLSFILLAQWALTRPAATTYFQAKISRDIKQKRHYQPYE